MGKSPSFFGQLNLGWIVSFTHSTDLKMTLQDTKEYAHLSMSKQQINDNHPSGTPETVIILV